MNNATNPADGTYVVVENGQRVTQPTTNKAEAEQAARERNKLAEAKGQQNEQRAHVKQNLMG